MADRGVAFSRPMVVALWDDRKNRTRRLLSPQPPGFDEVKALAGTGYHWFRSQPGEPWRVAGPVWAVRQLDGRAVPRIDVMFEEGDRLYVREDYYQRGEWIEDGLTSTGRRKWRFQPESDAIAFHAPEAFRKSMDRDKPWQIQWYLRRGRFMPRRYSRMWLLVTSVRVQRLQEITDEEARGEGIIAFEPTFEDPAEFAFAEGGDIWNDAREAFAALWNSLHTLPSERWSANPWIVEIAFSVHHGNLDLPEARELADA